MSLGAGQLLVLLLLLLLQPILLGLLQALAHLGGGEIIDQLFIGRIAPRRRLRLRHPGGLCRLGGFEQGLLGFFWSGRTLGRLRGLALLILRPVEGGQHGLGGHGGRDLNGGADVQRLGEELHPLVGVLEPGDLQDAIKDIDLGHQLLGTDPVFVGDLQRLLQLRLGLGQVPIVVGGRGRLILRLDLGQGRLLIGGCRQVGQGDDNSDDDRAGQRQSQHRHKPNCLVRRSGHASPATSNRCPIRL